MSILYITKLTFDTPRINVKKNLPAKTIRAVPAYRLNGHDNKNLNHYICIMKTIIILITVAILYGCGGDTVMNIGNNTSSVIFQVDSFSIRSNTVGLYDTNYTANKIYDLDSFKVSFSIYTNNDSSDYDLTRYSIVDNGRVILTHDIQYPRNNTHYSFNGYSDSGNVNKTFNIDLKLRNFFINANRYITVKNFRVETK